MKTILCVILYLASASTAFAETAPALLSETGLYSDIAAKTVAPDNLYYAPQYPLWSDGASREPSDPSSDRLANRYQRHGPLDFPGGNQVLEGVPISQDGWHRRKAGGDALSGKECGWKLILATYAWNEDESDASLASTNGIPNVYPSSPTTTHDTPSLSQCKFCHSRGGDPVLGFDPLQLSDDRDPLAPHTQTPTGLTLKTSSRIIS